MHKREGGYERHLVYIIVQLSNCFSIIWFIFIDISIYPQSAKIILVPPKMQNNFFISYLFFSNSPIDRAERYDLKSRLWIYFSPFLFPPKKRGKRKKRMNSKIVMLSHAFLLDQSDSDIVFFFFYLSYRSKSL